MSSSEDVQGDREPAPLISFLSAAQKCSNASLSINSTAIERCAELDRFINLAASSRLEVPVAAILRMNARAMYCASINTAMIGYRAALFPTLRASLEAACYAQEVEANPELCDVWLNRHRSEEDRKLSRRAFNGAVANTCKRLSRFMPVNSGLITSTYDAMIDDGAHPNVRSILPSIRLSETETHHEIALGMVLPTKVEYSLFCCYEIGLFTSWVMADFNELSIDFWDEATRLNDVKNDWERELASHALDDSSVA